MTDIRFYLDENISPVVGEQLMAKGIDTVTAKSLDMLSASDREHLEKAKELQRVLCTHDRDFFQLASEISDHAGIVFSQRVDASIGAWVRELQKLYEEKTSEDVTGQFIFLSLK